MTTPNAPACRDCRHWQQFSAVQERGKCRRYAPRPTIPTHDAQSWPETRREDWCGEHQPRTPEDRHDWQYPKTGQHAALMFGVPHVFETPCVFEHVARQRERDAWDACAEFGRNTIPRDGKDGILHQRERDRLYPTPEAK